MWRPDNWPTILRQIRKKYFDGDYGWEEPEVIAEAGADAMLEALMAKSIEIDISAPGMYITYNDPKEGWFVVIPKG